MVRKNGIKLVTVFFLILSAQFLFSENRITAPNDLIVLQDLSFRITAEASGTSGDDSGGGFSPLGTQKLPGRSQSRNETVTIRGLFAVDPSLGNEVLSIGFGPTDIVYSVYLNGKLISKYGRLQGAMSNFVNYYSVRIDLPPDLVNYGDAPNVLIIKTTGQLQNWTFDRILFGTSARVEEVVSWRNFFGVKLIIAACLLGVLLFVFFLLLFRARKYEEKKYLFFSVLCLCFTASYISMALNSGIANELLLEKISKAGFPLMLGFVTVLIIEFVKILHRKPWVKLLVLAPSLFFSVLIFLQKDFDGVLSVFGLAMNVLIVPGFVMNLTLLVMSVIRRRNRDVFILFASMLLILGTSVHDIIYSNMGGMKPYVWMIPYGYLGMVICLFFILSIEQAEIYLESLRREKDLQIAHSVLSRLNLAYEKFVPTKFLNLLEKKDIIEVKLGDQISKEMTVMFSDIRSFTTLSEKMTPDENFRFLNSYLSEISPVIRSHNGFIDKFMGDGIMALFPESPVDALQAAIDMRRKLALFNEKRIRKGFSPIEIGIGLNTGYMILGTIGEEERMEGTVISDCVNLASRLESLTKTFGARIIVSADVLKKLENRQDYFYRYLGVIRVVGKERSVGIYELFENPEEQAERLKIETAGLFRQSLEYYFKRDMLRSRAILQEILSVNPTDKAAAYYLDRCVKLSEMQLAEEWDGVETLMLK